MDTHAAALTSCHHLGVQKLPAGSIILVTTELESVDDRKVGRWCVCGGLLGQEIIYMSAVLEMVDGCTCTCVWRGRSAGMRDNVCVCGVGGWGVVHFHHRSYSWDLST